MKDVIIVGGGLKGMLTALFLHDAGLKVMLADQNELGRESSWAGGGLITPLYPWQAQRLSQRQPTTLSCFMRASLSRN